MNDHLLDLKPDKTGRTDGPDGDYDEFTLPDGLEMDGDTHHRFKQLARQNGLSQDQAQHLLDLHSEQIIRQRQHWVNHHQAQQQNWQKQSRTDRELAAQGRFEQNLAMAKKAVERFGGEKLAAALAETGAGNHPEILRCFYRIGKALAEDGFVAPAGKRQKKSYAETFYPDFNP